MLKEFPGAEVYSFEPHPTTFSALKEKTYGKSHVKIFNMAVGQTVGTMRLFEYEESQLSSLLVDAPYAVHLDKAPRGHIDVPCTTLDQFCRERELPEIDVLKIDTEGFDQHVLLGATGLLSRKGVKFVYLEINSIHPQAGKTGATLAGAENLLAPLGYKFITTYTERLNADGRFFLGSNALFALPPG
jgi:FkbM family methyltransferase